MLIFLCATRYFKELLIQPRVIKTMKHKSIAYLSLQVIHILCLHLSTVFLLKVLITKRTLSHQKSLQLLMLRPLRNHLPRCFLSSTIACYCYLFLVSQWNISSIWLILVSFLDAVLCLIICDISKTASNTESNIQCGNVSTCKLSLISFSRSSFSYFIVLYMVSSYRNLDARMDY
jgi:hypothetical protein